MSAATIGAYHVATFPNWEKKVIAQCSRIINSGLLACTDRILVGVVGEAEPAVPTIERLLDGKAEVRYFGNPSLYEFPTLQMLYDELTDSDLQCWYIHTKGVSNQCAIAERQRLYMESFVLDGHSECRKILEEYDACGTNWQLYGFDQFNPHFAGNFWWARSTYLKTLPAPNSLDVGDRYQAEFWIGKNTQIRPYCLSPVNPDPFAQPSAWIGLEHHYKELCEIEDPRDIHRIVDVGVDYGFSTFCFARDFPHADVVGVSDFPLHLDAEAWVRNHMDQFPNIRLLVGDSPSIGESFDEPIDLLHIDGDHSYEGVKRDFDAWGRGVKPGGRVIFHDTNSFASVRQFFNELPGRKKEVQDHHGLGCWYKEN